MHGLNAIVLAILLAKKALRLASRSSKAGYLAYQTLSWLLYPQAGLPG